ncbi:MAG: bifunctional folylpolyglutamate synthase/dihydrofolate synthase [Lachnospiraceae bacterium]|nr:bifunctional folylpolyglutamate synthase/dihydrofolate synthase [Lachnospiraceae bacterium]
MNYKQAMEYVESLQALGSVPGLDNIINLCEKLGNPQDDLRFLHIAGTNGKGSVSAYLSSVLGSAGYKVGTYNSPTIREYRERICVNGRMISQRVFCELLAQVKEACDVLREEGKAHPTPFEVETALGFLYFKEKKCNYVILECGMGGALDATNLVTTTAVAVFTPISMDHMGFLGETIAAIATQKAGIIKSGCRVVSAQQSEEAAEVIKKVSRQQQIEPVFVENEDASKIHYGLEKQSFLYQGRQKIEISLAGQYQIENALLALKVIDVLRDEGVKIPDRAVEKGFAGARWSGRFEVLGRKPYFVVDGAHNEDGARKLAQSIRFYFTNKKIIYIMGILKDKEYDKIISLTAPFATHIITVKTPDNPRAMDAYELAQAAMVYHGSVTAAGSLEEAVEMSYLLADKDSVIVSFGSLSYLGRMMEILEKRQRKE